MPTTPNVRVVVRLPHDRPDSENALEDPPPVIWNTEKADLLWKVIEKSRSSENGGADWKAMANYLQVPLPYLLYRVNARFQDEIRELKGIQGTLSPFSSHPQGKASDELSQGDKPLSGRAPSAMGGSTRLSSSSRLNTPVGVRARLNSLGQNTSRLGSKRTVSSSVLTLQGTSKKSLIALRPTSPSSSEHTDSEEAEEMLKEEEKEKEADAQEALDRKLEELQRMMTNEALGLVRATNANSNGKAADRGRTEGSASRSMTRSLRPDTLSSRSNSQSISSASSPQGSIPDIPSPSNSDRRMPPPHKSSSPPAVSPRNALGHSHRRYGPLVDRSSEQGSNQGSEASSFSDISDASLSASALESALMSNIRGTGAASRLSQFARSRLLGRGGNLHNT